MSVERELTNGTPPTLSLTIVDSGRDAILIWLELGTTLRACFGRGGVRTDGRVTRQMEARRGRPSEVTCGA